MTFRAPKIDANIKSIAIEINNITPHYHSERKLEVLISEVDYSLTPGGRNVAGVPDSIGKLEKNYNTNYFGI